MPAMRQPRQWPAWLPVRSRRRRSSLRPVRARHAGRIAGLEDRHVQLHARGLQFLVEAGHHVTAGEVAADPVARPTVTEAHETEQLLHLYLAAFHAADFGDA